MDDSWVKPFFFTGLLMFMCSILQIILESIFNGLSSSYYFEAHTPYSYSTLYLLAKYILLMLSYASIIITIFQENRLTKERNGDQTSHLIEIFAIISLIALLLQTSLLISYIILGSSTESNILGIFVFVFQVLFFLLYLGLMIVLWMKIYYISLEKPLQKIFSFTILLLGIFTSTFFINDARRFIQITLDNSASYFVYYFISLFTEYFERIFAILTGVFFMINSIEVNEESSKSMLE